MEYHEVEEPMPYCPRYEAPWVEEHEIQLAPESDEEPSPLYWIQRRGGPTEDCPESDDDFLGWSRGEAEHRLSQLADAESCRRLWQDYERRHRSRALLDVLSDRQSTKRQPPYPHVSGWTLAVSGFG